MWKPNAQGDGMGGGAFAMRLDYEGGALRNGIRALIKETARVL